ncbi:MAG: hypothetical protein ING75_01455 [Rhodocyclaceae bacterium]|nr:hypothetical protein [Rhodocyclaceae bacterium]
MLLGVGVTLLFLFGCAAEPTKIVTIPAEQVGNVPIRTGKTHQGQPIILFPYRLAGGEVKHLPVTDGGPLPAEDDSIKIQVSGLIGSRASEGQRAPQLAWVFGFTANMPLEIARVKIEQVFPSEVAISVVDHVEEAPLKKVRDWSKRAAAGDMTAEANPWFFKAQGSVFVFRFTIIPQSGKPIVLLQPTWISAPAKEALRKSLS